MLNMSSWFLTSSQHPGVSGILPRYRVIVSLHIFFNESQVSARGFQPKFLAPASEVQLPGMPLVQQPMEVQCMVDASTKSNYC